MANRKLQTEIEKTLKKVYEGIEVFEEIWDKAETASSSNQKEKFESELKKEISKLQRLRSQIRTWLASSEIKDKKDLLKARADVERNMEKFKIRERETKTKAYSKEGLEKLSEMDPVEREKYEMRDWVNTAVMDLQTQLDMFDADLETLEHGRAEQKRREDLEHHIARHRFHIKQLETILRCVENEVLNAADVNSIKDEVEAYVQHSQDDDFEEIEYIYDEFDLETLAEGLTVIEIKEEEARKGKAPKKKDEKKKETKPAPVLQKKPDSPILTSVQQKPIIAPSPTPILPTVATPAPTPAPVPQQATTSAPVHVPVTTAPAPVTTAPPAPAAAVVAAAAQIPPPSPSRGGVKALQSPKKVPFAQVARAHPSPAAATQPVVQQHAPVPAPVMPVEEKKPEPVVPVPVQAVQVPPQPTPIVAAQPPVQTSPPPPPQVDKAALARLTQALSVAFNERPSGADADVKLMYRPVTSANVPAYFPSTPLKIVTENPALFAKFANETLFFIFYHQPGTYQQYLASVELKKRSWRFHKRQLSWFKRHQEPTVLSQDREQGDYLYFDAEHSWCEKMRQQFTFEYCYLEED